MSANGNLSCSPPIASTALQAMTTSATATSSTLAALATPMANTGSNSTVTSASTTNVNVGALGKSRFPRLQECAHFHYEVNTVDLPRNFKAVMCSENETGQEHKSSSNHSSSSSSVLNENTWFHLQVTSNEKKWIIYRTYENFRYLDKFLHDCIFDRKFSTLDELKDVSQSKSTCSLKQIRQSLAIYLDRFSEIAFVNPINCGPILNWFEIDNKGNRLFAIDDSPINIPGVAAAVVKKRYVAQSLDELNLDVGNMISVIDMPPADESVWWRGKKELEVGFFPADCVELIKCNQPFSSNVADHLPKFSQNQSVRYKHGKLITLLRTFFNTRPARNQLQSKGILKQRVFACDLGEHLSNTQQEIPKILKICTEFIENYGIVDGIYRHTGLQSNIQKLRNAFDEEKFNEINQEVYINDVHSVSSLLKMYFRELPNPLLTYQLYHKFISIAEGLMKAVNVEDKIVEIHDVVQQLPPPHYRTLAFLMRHLHKLAEFSPDTNMNTKNLAIVWAPNLLKSKEMDAKDCMQYDMLHSITLQANISEFLIANADTIFNDKFASLVRNKHDMKNNIAKPYRPISICYNTAGAKLLSLEEAQDKYKQVGPSDLPKYHTVIEIPKLGKKKKNKSDKSKAANLMNGNIPPANVQIQQQFDALQQQQQQTTQSINIPTSSSSHSVVSASPNTISAAGSSSPAFKSLIRTLRMGSMKQTSTNTNQQQQQQPEKSSKLDILTMPISVDEKPVTPSLSRTASTSTFKPLTSSTIGITTPSNESAKLEFNNCINQLQSASSHMLNPIMPTSVSSFTGTLSPPTSTMAPVLLRNSKLNQSQHSIHSSYGHQQAPVLSTFKDSPSSSSSFDSNQPQKKGEPNSNPVPSKRRTIQFNSEMSLTLNQPKAPTNSNDDAKPIESEVNNSELCTRKSNNTDDDMHRLVAYINQFEKENNVLLNANSPSQQNESQQQSSNEMNFQAQVIASSLGDMMSIEEPSKLRLSSSSLSSSADSSNNQNLMAPIENEYEELTSPMDRTATIKITPNEMDTMVVTTQNLNSILTSQRAVVDRRTYIVNKIYDNEENSDENNKENEKRANGVEEEHYEKVILKHRDEEAEEKEEERHLNDIYDNDLLVQSPSSNEPPVIIVKRQNSSGPMDNKASPNRNEETEEHIYMNVNTAYEPKEPIIRESLGFEVSTENTYENGLQLNLNQSRKSNSRESIDSKKFDIELVELNSQIEELLGTNSNELAKQMMPKQEETQLRPKSALSLNTNDQERAQQRHTMIASFSSMSPSPSSMSTTGAGQQTKPVPSARSKIIANKTNEEPVKPVCTEVSESHTAQTKHLVDNQNRNQTQSVYVSSTSTTTSAHTPTTNELKVSNESNKRRKSENSENEINRIIINSNKNALNVVPRNRQSISVTQTSSQIGNGHHSNQNNNETTTTNSIRNTNRNMSKSLQDNSRILQLNKNDQQPQLSNQTDEVKNVKSKIKLMESIVNKQSQNTTTERSSSQSSTSSSSSSRSPPLSPKVKSTSKQIAPSQIELVPISTKQTNAPAPPSITARSTSNVAPATAPRPPKSALSTHLNKLNGTNTNTGSTTTPSNGTHDDPNQIAMTKQALNNLKEKRRTVKELLSQFEPK